MAQKTVNKNFWQSFNKVLQSFSQSASGITKCDSYYTVRRNTLLTHSSNTFKVVIKGDYFGEPNIFSGKTPLEKIFVTRKIFHYYSTTKGFPDKAQDLLIYSYI